MEKLSEIAELDAPFNKKITFQKVEYENGFQFLRMRIKEGKRFTIIDLDVHTAQSCADTINQWIGQLD
ncbi:MAG: hypothetical protein OEZ43_18295 [Gammaproteobacteria bacterium]|nr:hypothetical protein [Gammaproteobacteria bacterium]